MLHHRGTSVGAYRCSSLIPWATADSFRLDHRMNDNCTPRTARQLCRDDGNRDWHSQRMLCYNRTPPLQSESTLMSDATRILQAIEQGDPHAAEELLPLVYEELRKLAAASWPGEARTDAAGDGAGSRGVLPVSSA